MATATLLPDGDILANWDTAVPGGTHYTTIDEGTVTPNDTDYVQTTTLDDIDRFSFSATPGNTSQVTQIDVKTRCGINDASDAAYIEVALFHSTSTQIGTALNITTTDIGFNDGTLATVTKSWTSLTLTKAQADSLEVRYTFKSA